MRNPTDLIERIAVALESIAQSLGDASPAMRKLTLEEAPADGAEQVFTATDRDSMIREVGEQLGIQQERVEQWLAENPQS